MKPDNFIAFNMAEIPLQVQEKLKAYDKRAEYYGSRSSPTKYWIVFSKSTGKKIKETSRGWEVAQYDPDKVVVKHVSYAKKTVKV